MTGFGKISLIASWVKIEFLPEKASIKFNTLDATRLFEIPAYNAKLFTRASALKPNCFYFS